MAEARMNGVEATVMALWDAGRSSQQIAAALQLNPEWVRKIVSMFDAGAEDRLRIATARAGCALYTAALARTGKVYA